MPPPVPVGNLNKRKIDELYDFVVNSVATPGERQKPGELIEAMGTNTLGEVPDSEWYTNRHYWRQMSMDELVKGPTRGNEPVAPFHVVGAKTEGITPGFQMLDAKGRRYFCKPDPASNPEMATAADVIGSRFFYAFGYNTPENYIFYYTKGQISVAPNTKITGLNGKDRLMNDRDLERVLEKIPRDREGRYRMMASLVIPGKGVGPFRWYGQRADDPNDLYRHENRRELRGLYVFCEWLNHTDIKAGNTYDTVVDFNGTPAIRHYLIDFGASLGSDSDAAKNPRFGHEYMIETDKTVLLKMFDLGLYSPKWERTDYGDIPAVGHFTAEAFDPDRWTSNYPNAAFLNRLPDDTFWAAKQVMAFSDDEIRALVKTGDYSNPQAAERISEILIKRRDKIGRTFFNEVLPLDRFAVADGRLQFDDLALKYNFIAAREYDIQWSEFDNETGRTTQIAAETSMRLPRTGDYLMARISSASDPQKIVRVYVRGGKVIGIDRTW